MINSTKFKIGDRIRLAGSNRLQGDVIKNMLADTQGNLCYEFENGERYFANDDWELVEESKVCMYSTANFTNGDRLTLCKDCEELCKYNQKTAAESLGISQEVYDEIVDKYLYGTEVELVDDGDLPKEEPASEDLEKEINEYISILTERRGDFPKLTKLGFRTIARHFANWQKEHLMAKAIRGRVSFNVKSNYHSLIYGCWDMDNALKNCNEGDEVKVLVIKE